jgi:IPT/TIG domain
MRSSLVLLLVALVCVGCGTSDPPAKNDPPHSRTAPVIQPAIAMLTPSSVPVNSVPFTMTVNGSDFGTDAVVFFNGAPLTTTFITPMQVVAQLTSANLMFAGLTPVYVRTQGFNSNTVDFDVTIQ